MECAGFKQIMAHIRGQNLINAKQHGGRKCHSTNTCVLEVLGNVKTAKEKKMLTGILSVDMSSAYSCINHRILLQKLRIMGLAPHTLLWVENFLSERQQCVEINGKLSETIETGAQGVVQGGASSGDLFLVYLNDVPDCTPLPGKTRPDADASQYVDDINLVAFGKTKQKLKVALQDCYLNMERVLSDHRMVINGGKTQLMIITNKKDLKSISILAAGQTINHQEKMKILGINLSSSLKFDDHIKEGKKSLTKSIFQKMSILKSVKLYVEKKTLARIGESLIGSTILFGAPVWSQTTDKNISFIQSAQTKAARIVSGDSCRGNRTNRTHRQVMMTDLGWKNVKHLITMANLNLLKQALEKKSALSINNSFKQSQPAHPRGLATIRVNYNGSISRSENSFEVQASREFNNLPELLRSPLLTVIDFKKRLKEHVLTIHHLACH